MDAALFSAYDVNTERAALSGSKELADGSRIVWGLSRREFGPMSFKDRPAWDIAANRLHFLRLFGLHLDELVSPHLDHTSNVRIVGKADMKKGARSFKEAFEQTDGLVTKDKNVILMTTHADCLPIWMACPESGWIGMVHAGWKGLLNGIIENMIDSVPEADHYGMTIAIGPGISAKNYEIGQEVADQFKSHPILKVAVLEENGHYHLDLRKGAELIGKSKDVNVDSSMFACTYDNNYLSSFRRDGAGFTPMGAFIVRR